VDLCALCLVRPHQLACQHLCPLIARRARPRGFGELRAELVVCACAQPQRIVVRTAALDEARLELDDLLRTDSHRRSRTDYRCSG
jgi:hypothetical protein